MKKIAVIGSGRMGEVYCQAISQRPDAKLVAVVGNTPEKTKALADKYKVPAFAQGNYAPLLKDKDVDAWLVATPEWERVKILQDLVATGKPILLEKPLAASWEDLQGVQKITHGARDRICVTHSLRMSPKYVHAKKMLEAGHIGQIRHLSARRNPPQVAVRRVLGKFPLAFWLSCHDIDVMRWFTGAEVESVFATSRAGAKSEDDYILAQLKFTNGVDAIEEVSWCTPELSNKAPTCDFVLKGSKGVLEINDHDMNVTAYGEGLTSLQGDTFDNFPSPDGSRVYGSFYNLIDLWLYELQTGSPHFLSLANAEAAAKACALIDRSLATGKIVYAREL